MKRFEKFSDIDFEKEQLDFKADALLREKGWKETSSTPGSLWLWERKLDDGRIVLVNKASAIHMQNWFDYVNEEEVPDVE